MIARTPRCHDGQSDGRFFVLVEIERFAAVRHAIGGAMASRIVASLRDAVADHVTRDEIGRVGRTGIDFMFAADGRAAADAFLRSTLLPLLERRVEVDGFIYDPVVTIGVAESTGTIDDILVDEAAAAVDLARQRRTKISWADDDDAVAEASSDLAILRDLPAAIANDELQLYYQPKLRARTDRIDSAEALLRWPRTDGAMVPVDRLIRLAEDTGAIRGLTEWVIARAVADQHRLAAAGHDLTIYVNISGLLLSSASFADIALALTASAGGRIGFEITETAVIDDPDRALRQLHRFVEAGIKLAIDDYGSGLSSLAYLKQLPAHELKIDRMFISGLIDSHRDPLLVRSSIDLAHALDMEVTAEGVDDPMALALLRVMGCDLIQGYLISPPLPHPDLLAFLDGEVVKSRIAPAHFQARFATSGLR